MILQLTLTGIRWFSLLRAVGIRCSLWEALSRSGKDFRVEALEPQTQDTQTSGNGISIKRAG